MLSSRIDVNRSRVSRQSYLRSRIFIVLHVTVRVTCISALAITFGYLQWLVLKTYLSPVTERNSEDKTLYLHFTQPLQIAAVVRCIISSQSNSVKIVFPSYSILEMCRTELSGFNGVQYLGYLITISLFVNSACNVFKSSPLSSPRFT